MRRELRSFDCLGLLATLCLLTAASLPGLIQRSIWHDETITLLETSSGPTDWPERPVPAGELKSVFEGRKGMADIAEVLRVTDIHPPGYYWILSWWRSIFGSSVTAARLLSLISTLASVVVLFQFLRSAGSASPVPATLVFALATYTVHLSHEARNYALGIFVLLLATFLAWESVKETGAKPTSRTYMLGIVGGVLAGFGFLTGYLSIFWAISLGIWYAIFQWPRGAALAATFPGAAAISGVGGWVALGLTRQLSNPGTRQDAGFHGWWSETRGILVSLLDLLANHESYWGRRAVFLLVVALLVLGLWRLMNEKTARLATDKRVLLLFAGIAATGIAGIFILDVVRQKHLYRATRYFAYLLPALAILLTYGVSNSRTRRERTFGWSLLLILGVLQLGSVNWTDERCRGGRRMGRPHRSVAATIADSNRARVVALIGVGNGRGDPWSYVYEMNPAVPVSFVHWRTEPRRVLGRIEQFNEVWLLKSFDRATAGAEERVWAAILESGEFRDASVGQNPFVRRAVRIRLFLERSTAQQLSLGAVGSRQLPGRDFELYRERRDDL